MAAAWLASDFNDLHEGLLAVAEFRDIKIDQLEDILQIHRDYLKQLLDQPPKNDAHRQKVNSGKVTIREEDCEINQEFVQLTLQLAEDLDLDEQVAAELLYTGNEQAEQLDRSPAQAAILLYHSRRHKLLESLRLILSLSHDESVDQGYRDALSNTVKVVVGNVKSTEKGDFAQKCISAMARIRMWLKGLSDKERTATFHIHPVEFLEDLRVQSRSLLDQHEVLGSIVYELVQHDACGLFDLDAIKLHLKGHQNYDALLVHQLLGFWAIISQLGTVASKLTNAAVTKINEGFQQSANGDERWELQYTQATCNLWWFTEYNGLIKEPPANITLQVDYMKEIHEPSKQTLNDGAMDFLMAVVADINKGDGFGAAQDDFRRSLQAKTPFDPPSMETSDDFRRSFLSQVEVFMDSFISNMADLLKEIKHLEEEDNLLQRETTYNLERFFFVISLTFHNRNEAGMTFWSDKESNLFGFLVWASNKQTPLMAAAYCDVLASLSFGVKAADAANKFLSEEVSGIGQKLRRTHQFSWEYIFQALEYYVSKLSPPMEQAVGTGQQRVPPPQYEPSELDDQSTRVVVGYLRLIAQISTFSSTARETLSADKEFNAIDILFRLLDCSIGNGVMASIYNVLTAFLIDRSCSEHNVMWTKLDNYLGSTKMHQAMTTTGLGTLTSFMHPENKFVIIGESFAATEAFVGLVVALLQPVDRSSSDTLPFPEALGSTTRTGGIDDYVDFVLKLLGNSMKIDPATGYIPWSDADLPRLQRCCLDFILSCLRSFNEQLIVIANTSNIAVDAAIDTFDLATYVKLHPFARVMDHLFSESVLSVLFSILQTGVETVPSLPIRKPTVQAVKKSIEVMDCILQMQHTYLEVVRPLVWEDERSSKKQFATIGLGSFEDAVLYHLQVIANLGNYAGCRQTSLALAALSVLIKLSISPKLTSAPVSNFGPQTHRSRLLSIADSEGESRRIAFSFIQQLDATVQSVDLEDSPELLNNVKVGILNFLEASLNASPNEPALAHLILGFSIEKGGTVGLSVEASGIGSGIAVFHTILGLLNEWESQDKPEISFSIAACDIKAACFRVLRTLWQSNLTSEDTMMALRKNKLFFEQFSREIIITPATEWDGCSIEKGNFFISEAADGCIYYLHSRTATFDYIAQEMRLMSKLGAAGMIREYVSSLNGQTVLDGERIENVSLFDLLDFLDMEPLDPYEEPRLEYFGGLNFSTYQNENNGISLWDIDGVTGLLSLRKIELGKQGRLLASQEDAANVEIATIQEYFFFDNQVRKFRVAKLECLRYWCRLIVVVLENAQFQTTEQTDFVLQALQTILPKLEIYSTNDMSSAQELSSLAQSLVTKLEFDLETFGRGRASDVTNDRLYNLFRVALRSIQAPLASARLREDFYSIAHTYLSGMNNASLADSAHTRHSLQSVRASGERLLDVLCKDAYLGAGNCKLLALLLLDSLVQLGQQEESSYILEALVRQNFIVVLVQSLRRIDKEAEQVRDGGFALTTMVKASTGLLLRLSQTKAGASMVFNAGFYTILRECGLFSVDPDIGIGFASEKDLPRYYELVLSFIRVLVSCLLSKGIHSKNETIQARKFLQEIRPIVVSVLKKEASIGGNTQDKGDIGPLVDMFVVLFCVAESVEANVPDTAGP